MAWDFSTEPEFEAKLEWTRTFVREEIMPLETLADRWRTVLPTSWRSRSSAGASGWSGGSW